LFAAGHDPPVNNPYAQDGFRVAFDWGPTGAAVMPRSLVAVIDVLDASLRSAVVLDQIGQ
jgi:2-phosphosulfolactate phosphatase